MGIHFYKLQCGGNCFILIDTSERQNLILWKANDEISLITKQSSAAVRLCSRRYGVGASGVIFIEKNGETRIFDSRGRECLFAADAFLCAARYLFDSGRVSQGLVQIGCYPQLQKLSILGSCDFRISMGSPFLMKTGKVIDASMPDLLQTVTLDKTTVTAAAIHIQEDVAVLFSSAVQTLPLRQISYDISRSFSGNAITAAVVKNIQSNSSAIHCTIGGMSSACASAAAAVITTTLAGTAATEQIIYFEDHLGSVVAPSDSNGITGRRVGVFWNQAENNVYITGSGAYLFDGNVDIPEFSERPLD